MTWIHTYGGAPFDLVKPRARDVDFCVVAIALGRLPRFGGHTRQWYSVAEHSLVVSGIACSAEPHPAVRLLALLHDAHEAYTGDVVTPMQEALGPAAKRKLKALQAGIDAAVFGAAGLRLADAKRFGPLVKEADLLALSTERAAVLHPSERKWQLRLPAPLEWTPEHLEPDRAAKRWLAAVVHAQRVYKAHK